MGRQCQEMYARYDMQSGPKAFAKGRTRACAWKARGVRSVWEAERLALNMCRRQRGDDCRIIDSRRY